MQHEPYLLDLLRRRRHDFDAVLLDIDGTLTDHGHALPGTVEMLAWLRRDRVPFLCLTNDGNHPVTQKAEFLQRCGLDIARAEIVSCAHAIFNYAAETGLAGRPVFIMGQLGVRFPPIAGAAGENPGPPAAEPDSRVFSETHDLELLPECAGVIVGEGAYDWFRVVSGVFNFFVHKPDAFLIVPNPDSYWPDGRRGLGIGAGGVARFIQRLLQDFGQPFEPVYLGKPYPRIFEDARHCLQQRHGAQVGAVPERIWVIGDSLQADVQGANGVGFRSVLILTGITKARRLEADCRRTGIHPWLVADLFTGGVPGDRQP